MNKKFNNLLIVPIKAKYISCFVDLNIVQNTPGIRF